ncbi:lipopolysaccharide biosynthesis protein [Desulfosediminicola flagellatus]|uniref:lipopolysaccharide biosynthesis protein n=1 Tax=Desulfosediminicola flagellatus TaxID=2569541 RepID=UPI0010ABC197|nr:hypothetical protein [Desulfosediminicola flagellatus]
MLISIFSRLTALKTSSPGYLSALISGYLLMGAYMVVQFGLTPLYLKYLGEQQFGLLMMLLSFINFVAVGITWMSGGLVRKIGECWVKTDLDGFRDAIVVGKYVYTLYASLVVVAGSTVFLTATSVGGNGESFVYTVLPACFYLVLNYEALPERQAFFGTNNQATGNCFELTRVIVFACLTLWLLPRVQNMSAVWYGLIGSVMVQRLLTGLYWQSHVGGTGWRRFSQEMKPVFRRLAGKQGAGYVTYGALLLLLQADTLLVGFVGGAEMAGKFVLLWKVPEAIGLLLWKIPSSIEPRVISLDASGEHSKLQGIYITGRRWFLTLTVLVSLSYMVGGHWLAELWVGEFAPDAGWMYIAGGLALFFNTFARWPISFSYAMIRLPELIRVAGIEVIGKVIFIGILFPFIDIAAPIVASVIMHVGYVGWKYQNMLVFEEVEK